MAFNGSGLFVIDSTGQPVSANTLIESADFNALTADLAAGLSNCITKDGQQTITANLPMATYRHTGVGNAVARTDYAAAGQVQDGKLNWVDGGGTADAITATYSPSITALVDGQLCCVRATASNATTTPTFSPNGLTARTIVKVGGTALAVGEIVGDGHELILRYDLTNTRWELINPRAASLAANTFTGLQTWKASADIASAATVDLTAATGNTTRITGTTATSAFTMTAGQWHMVIADGAWPLTYHATTNKLNTGGSNYTCAAGDRVLLHKDNSGIIQATIFKNNGTAVVSSSYYAGQVIQEVYATDAGSTTTSATLANVTASTKTITPKSSNSTIIVECMFDGKIAAGGAGTNTTAKFMLYDYGNSADIGQEYTLGVGSGAGANVQTEAPCNLAAYVSNAALTARSFTLRARYGTASATVTATNHVWRIREVQN